MLAELAAPHTLFHQGDHVVGIEAHPAVRGDISKFAAIHHPLDLALPNTKNLADLLGSEHQPLRLDSHAVYDHLGHGHSLYRARDFWIKWPAMGVGVAVSVVAHAHGAAGRLQARVVAGAAVGLAIAWLLLALAPATALAAGPTWGVASEIQQPPDKSPGAGVSFLDHISCGAPGNCAAVGSYSLLNASGEGMMGVVGSGSIWGQASAILPPANSSIGRPLTTGPVACPPSGSCIAGGYYTAVGGEYGMVTSETGGVWSQGKEIALPANASTTLADIFLFGAACAAQGSCVVVGAYITGNGESAPLIVSENGGVWAQGIEPSLPAGANGAVASQLNGVACPAANACVAVGGYTESDGENHLWVLSQAAGKWGQASTIALPANAKSGSANSVACRSVGNCLMVGDYETSAEEHVGFVVTENAGVWGPASEVPVPGGSVDIGIESVACPPTGACVALGPDFVVNESAPGVWTATEIEVALPASAYEPYGTPNFALDSIACPVAGGCIIAGEYVSSVGGIVPIIVNETNGGPYNGAVAKTGPLLENTLSPSGGGTVEFSGTITPGNLASGLEWWFEYGPVGTNFNATACAESQTPCASGGPMETPRKQLSATPGTCPGIATPEPCVWARNTFPLSPYTPYEYRLVVQEGQQPPVFGATLPLIPGNLINPRNFKPTGRYNLAIVCPSACQTLLHADAQHAGGGLAFGQFALTSSTPAGEIGGLGEVLTLHNGKSPEKHGFLFKGNLLLSRVNMNLSPLPGPVTIASPFSLAGAVNYGHTGLEPFAFAGNLSGGGYWEACLQNTGAGSCSPPDHPDKTTAGTVSGVAGVASTAAGFAVIPEVSLSRSRSASSPPSPWRSQPTRQTSTTRRSPTRGTSEPCASGPDTVSAGEWPPQPASSRLRSRRPGSRATRSSPRGSATRGPRRPPNRSGSDANMRRRSSTGTNSSAIAAARPRSSKPSTPCSPLHRWVASGSRLGGCASSCVQHGATASRAASPASSRAWESPPPSSRQRAEQSQARPPLAPQRLSVPFSTPRSLRSSTNSPTGSTDTWRTSRSTPLPERQVVLPARKQKTRTGAD